MNCEEAKKHFQELTDDEMSPELEKEIRKHLRRCVDCQEELIQLKKVIVLLNDLDIFDPPPDIIVNVNKAIDPDVSLLQRLFNFFGGAKLTYKAFAVAIVAIIIIYMNGKTPPSVDDLKNDMVTKHQEIADKKYAPQRNESVVKEVPPEVTGKAEPVVDIATESPLAGADAAGQYASQLFDDMSDKVLVGADEEGATTKGSLEPSEFFEKENAEKVGALETAGTRKDEDGEAKGSEYQKGLVVDKLDATVGGDFVGGGNVAEMSGEAGAKADLQQTKPKKLKHKAVKKAKKPKPLKDSYAKDVKDEDETAEDARADQVVKEESAKKDTMQGSEPLEERHGRVDEKKLKEPPQVAAASLPKYEPAKKKVKKQLTWSDDDLALDEELELDDDDLLLEDDSDNYAFGMQPVEAPAKEESPQLSEVPLDPESNIEPTLLEPETSADSVSKARLGRKQKASGEKRKRRTTMEKSDVASSTAPEEFGLAEVDGDVSGARANVAKQKTPEFFQNIQTARAENENYIQLNVDNMGKAIKRLTKNIQLYSATIIRKKSTPKNTNIVLLLPTKNYKKFMKQVRKNIKWAVVKSARIDIKLSKKLDKRVEKIIHRKKERFLLVEIDMTM